MAQDIPHDVSHGETSSQENPRALTVLINETIDVVTMLLIVWNAFLQI